MARNGSRTGAGPVGAFGQSVTITAALSATEDPTSLDCSVSVPASVLRRRIGTIWILLLANAMPWIGGSLFPVPRSISQVGLMAALLVAFLMAVRLNPRLAVRPSVFLAFVTVLAVLAVVVSLRGSAGVGGVIRSFRLSVFTSVLWLLSPWWGRRDLLIVRCHLRALLVVLATVILGAAVKPGAALGGRLAGILWPIPPPQVAEYSAIVVGMSVALWMSGLLVRRQALLFGVGGLALVLLSHTRTALVALIVGVISAAAATVWVNRRARRTLGVALVLVPIVLVALAPVALTWFARGQDAQQIGSLTGRKKVWEALIHEPRSELTRFFGRGLSDKSAGGLSIDSTWLAAYQEQGLVGAFVIGSALCFLIVVPIFRPSAPGRAVATFLVVYCAIASYTEVTIGDVSPYLLHLVVAASLLAWPARAAEPLAT